MHNRLTLNYTARVSALAPRFGHPGDAGMDLCADLPSPQVIFPDQPPMLISTGVSVALPRGYFGIVTLRSSMGAAGFSMPHGIGVIDSGYRGVIKVAITRLHDAKAIQPYHRIAQLVVVPLPIIDLNQVASLDDTPRGAGGFGSTGEK
jgi:dUTP pyrophosphatase